MIVKEKNPIDEMMFWQDLENESKKIIKWNPEGKYNRTFNQDQKQFLDYFDNLPTIPQVHVGQTMIGKVSNITEEGIVIDINYKDYIFVDVRKSEKKIVSNIQIGDDINVMIMEISSNPYMIKGSVMELIKNDVIDKIRSSYVNKTSLSAKINEMIPAGFIMDILMNNITIPAFMPNTLAGVNRLTEAQSIDLVGKSIEVQLETLQQDKGYYVVSRRKHLTHLIPEKIEELKKALETDPYKGYIGTITGSRDFGLFVEFEDCLTGMIHKSNINPEFKDTFQKIPEGTPIEFYVKDVIKNNKIILTQVYNDSLWDTIEVGQKIEGTVIDVKPFGAIIKLDDETIGLIQTIYIEKFNQTLQPNYVVKVKVISVIRETRKIYLDITR